MEGRGLGVNGNHDNDIGIGNDCIERKVASMIYIIIIIYHIETKLPTITHTTYLNSMYKDAKAIQFHEWWISA